MKTPSIMGLDIDISACTERSFFYGEKVQGNFAIPFKCANVSWEAARAFTDMELEEQLFKKDKEPSI